MISNRTGHVLRVLTVVAFAAAGVMAWNLLQGPDEIEEVQSDADALDVATAIGVSRAQPLTVRGYVFEGPGTLELRLCNGRQGSDPPRCIGPYIALEQLDRGSFDLRQGKADGKTVRWSPEPATMTGILVGTVFTVQVVLG